MSHFSDSDLNKARDLVAQMDDGTRKVFLEKYQGLSSENQGKVLERLLISPDFSQVARVTPEQQQNLLTQAAQSSMMPLPSNIGGGPPPAAVAQEANRRASDYYPLAGQLAASVVAPGIGTAAGRLIPLSLAATRGAKLGRAAIPLAKGLTSTGVEALGAGAGSLLAEAQKALSGQEFNASKVQDDTLMTFLATGGLKGAGFTIFKAGRIRAVEKLGGQYLAEVKKALSAIPDTDANYQIPKDKILNPIVKALESIEVKRGPQYGALVYLKNKLSDQSVTHISPKQLIQFEEYLGSTSKFDATKVGTIVNKAANRESVKLRGIASNEVDSLAQKYTHNDKFSRISKEVSLAKKELAKEKSGGFLSGIKREASLLGMAVGLATQNVGLGIGAAIGSGIMMNPKSMAAIYTGTKVLGTDVATKLAAAEAFRRYMDESRNQRTE